MPSIRPTSLRISHHTPWQLYTIAIIHHGRKYTTPIIHHGREHTMAIAHHGRGRCTCKPCPRKVQCNAPAYYKILCIYFGACWIREMISFCIGVNTSDASLICLFGSCFYALLSDRYTDRNIMSTDGANAS